MEIIKEYVKPELIVVAFVLYFIGMALKSSKIVSDRFIPIVLGVIGILFSAAYVLSETSFDSVQSVFAAVFTAFVQGVLVAGLSTYVNQIVKQLKDKEK